MSIVDSCPPWVLPGNQQAKLYLTANCAFWIQYHLPQTIPAKKAADFISSQLLNKGYIDSYQHTNWISAGLFSLLGRSDELAQTLEKLNRLYVDLSADNLVWMANTLILSGFSKDNVLLQNVVDRLIPLQTENGYWDSDDGEWQRIHITIEALRAINFVANISTEVK